VQARQQQHQRVLRPRSMVKHQHGARHPPIRSARPD
jgi:hypothetical protein